MCETRGIFAQPGSDCTRAPLSGWLSASPPEKSKAVNPSIRPNNLKAAQKSVARPSTVQNQSKPKMKPKVPNLAFLAVAKTSRAKPEMACKHDLDEQYKSPRTVIVPWACRTPNKTNRCLGPVWLAARTMAPHMGAQRISLKCLTPEEWRLHSFMCVLSHTTSREFAWCKHRNRFASVLQTKPCTETR